MSALPRPAECVAPATARIAAVIVNFETPELTIEAVESVLGSRGVDVSVVVIDNASRDESVARLTAYFAGDTPVQVIARARNDGFTGGNNAGVDIARQHGAAFAFLLNSDAMVDPDCLRLLLVEAERDSEIALVVPRIFFREPAELLWFGGGRVSLWRGRAIHVGFRRPAASGWQSSCDAGFASGCALLVRLSAVKGTPLFDRSLFSYGEDLDLSLRVRRGGHRIRYVPQARALHVDGASHRATTAGSDALRFYLSTRNTLRVLGAHARWYHWPVLAPSLVVDLVARYCVATLRRRDWRACGAVFRGVVHSITGGRHPLEGAN